MAGLSFSLVPPLKAQPVNHGGVYNIIFSRHPDNKWSMDHIVLRMTGSKLFLGIFSEMCNRTRTTAVIITQQPQLTHLVDEADVSFSPGGL